MVISVESGEAASEGTNVSRAPEQFDLEEAFVEGIYASMEPVREALDNVCLTLLDTADTFFRKVGLIKNDSHR